MIAGSSLFFPMIHMKYVVFMSLWPRTVKILIQTDLGRENSAIFFKKKGGEDLFLPWSNLRSGVIFFLLLCVFGLRGKEIFYYRDKGRGHDRRLTMVMGWLRSTSNFCTTSSPGLFP